MLHHEGMEQSTNSHTEATMHQESFWGNVDYPSNEAARAARDARARELKQQGIAVRKSVLRDQLRPYAAFGVPDGRVGHVYIVEPNRRIYEGASRYE